MDVASLTVNGSGISATAGTGQSMDGITGSDFMSILIKQLQYQDPFEPMSNEEMVSQMATIRELETNTRLSDKLSQITDEQRFGSAAALIGKYAQGVVADSEGNQYAIAGIVTGVRFTEQGNVMLELDSGQMLPLAGLQQVSDPEGLLGSFSVEV